MLRRTSLVTLMVLTIIALAAVPSSTASTGVGNVPQGLQGDRDYARSVIDYGVTNVLATTQRTSCHTPEVPYFTSLAPANAYFGNDSGAGKTFTTSVSTYNDGTNPSHHQHQLIAILTIP